IPIFASCSAWSKRNILVRDFSGLFFSTDSFQFVGLFGLVRGLPSFRYSFPVNLALNLITIVVFAGPDRPKIGVSRFRLLSFFKFSDLGKNWQFRSPSK